jgi:3-deoxy-D-manno-octulosonic-acid transferase
MYFLYNVFVLIASKLLYLAGFFSPKIKLFVAGRVGVFEELEKKLNPTDKTIWFHAASLGEYEQGLPVIQKIKEQYPLHKILVTFFSPSGYEVRKNNTVADITVYLPLDTKKNAKKFIALVKPELTFFIKYEYWPNYLNELKKRSLKTYLISGILRENQAFFKWYGGFYRNALNAFTYFFVQNESSKNLLLQLGKTNVAVSGDTRFDRVAEIVEKDNTLDFIASFKNNQITLVAGSTWTKDEALLVDYINSTTNQVKYIIAPHNIDADQISKLQESLSRKSLLYSEKDGKNLAEYDVFIIDTIGILTKIYSYGDIAYVGGGFGNPGIHNILEPATFGIPVVVGPNYAHFAEAKALVALGGCITITNKKELHKNLYQLIADENYRNELGHICQTFIEMNKGATTIIVSKI